MERYRLEIKGVGRELGSYNCFQGFKRTCAYSMYNLQLYNCVHTAIILETEDLRPCFFLKVKIWLESNDFNFLTCYEHKVLLVFVQLIGFKPCILHPSLKNEQKHCMGFVYKKSYSFYLYFDTTTDTPILLHH